MPAEEFCSSWRPAKKKKKNAVGLALLPCRVSLSKHSVARQTFVYGTGFATVSRHSRAGHYVTEPVSCHRVNFPPRSEQLAWLVMGGFN